MKKEETQHQNEKDILKSKIASLQVKLESIEKSLKTIDQLVPNQEVKSWSTMKLVKYFVIILVVSLISLQIITNFIPKHEYLRPY